VKKAAEKLGEESEKFAMQVKDLEDVSKRLQAL